MMTPGGSRAGCIGGRLGRDHTLEDVPRHYLRDRLMDYINTNVPDKRKRAARKAICPDLTDAKIRKYTELIAQDRVRVEEAQEEQSAKNAARNTAVARYMEAKEAAAVTKVKHREELEEALAAVDKDVDLEPCDGVPRIVRNPERPRMIERSVVKPGSLPMPGESQIGYQYDIDRDCDQVRAMIKIFVTEGEWTLDGFRQALQRVSRQQLTTFLKKTGNDGQKKTAAYQLSWEFFNWRESLGLPLKGARVADDVAAVRTRERERQKAVREREREQKRAKKRASADVSGRAAAPRAKRQRKVIDQKKVDGQENVKDQENMDCQKEADDQSVIERGALQEIVNQAYESRPSQSRFVIGASGL